MDELSGGAAPGLEASPIRPEEQPMDRPGMNPLPTKEILRRQEEQRRQREENKQAWQPAPEPTQPAEPTPIPTTMPETSKQDAA